MRPHGPVMSLNDALEHGARIAVIVIGLLALIVALHQASFLLAPFGLAIIIGLMFGPVASRLERMGAPSPLSAIAVVLIFLALAGAFMAAVATPLAAWADRLPQIWNELQLQLSALRQPLETLTELRQQLRSVIGDSDVRVSVSESSPVENVAVLAPTLLAQLLIFFASLYFFVATRHQTRAAVLKLCIDRRLRQRVAHIFRDVEAAVSKYLLSIAIINTGLGIAVTGALWLAGMPSPALWGALAALLNFIIYIGPAMMAIILFAVGLASFDTLAGSFMPPLIYLSINAVEAQFVTPTVIGWRMTMNPFIVFMAIAFWLWLWGPVGGFIAIPALLIVHVVTANVLAGARPRARRQG